jgi:uncharacterized protein
MKQEETRTMVAAYTHRPVELITRREAQALATIAQGLAGPPPRRRIRSEDLKELVDRLSCIQLDTISVISRSHETVAWSRLGSYDRAYWDTLYDPLRAVSEYWAHAAAIVPLSDLRLHRPVMERFRNRARQQHTDATRQLHRAVLERIRTRGPMSSLDFEAMEGATASAWQWYGHKPERRALAELWSEGALVVRRRDAFRRVFDLTERIVPDLWHGEIDEPARRLALGRKALCALGVTTLPWFVDYFRTGGQPHLPRAVGSAVMAELEENHEAIPVSIKGIEEPAWLHCVALPGLDRLRQGRGWPTRTTLLSPFDNLVWNRQRDQELWDFHYRLECYTPAPKRRFGYYSLPILHRGRLVGRLDPSFDRKARLLTIRSLHWEPEARVHSAMERAVAGAIGRLCEFLGGESDRWAVSGHPPCTVPSNR